MNRKIFENAASLLKSQTDDYLKRKELNSERRSRIQESILKKSKKFEERKRTVREDLSFIRKK
ncbi:hypothetical protein MM326_11095 [Alkalihalobacillus sp. LMS6]|uniref:hypothetical protein n=1 Tax=Alkalihalobacillus sp. LMS6 TaxID=2924034 RepID=UPI0020D108FE|nr:hypothetical protein [Alkalihalobacillus sp. LMS6]UTR04687.1 hypothetical protein MM326_11095 [Alkalihalobacillus sp. LMS6]